MGDGPLADRVATAAAKLNGVEWLGRKPLEEIYQLMGKAKFLIIPSEWYETFGRVGIEALAKGTPLIVAKVGALSELVKHQYNVGLAWPGSIRPGSRRPGDSGSMAAKSPSRIKSDALSCSS